MISFDIVLSPPNIVIESYSQIHCIPTLGCIHHHLVYYYKQNCRCRFVLVINDNLFYIAVGIHVEIQLGMSQVWPRSIYSWWVLALVFLLNSSTIESVSLGFSAGMVTFILSVLNWNPNHVMTRAGGQALWTAACRPSWERVAPSRLKCWRAEASSQSHQCSLGLIFHVFSETEPLNLSYPDSKMLLTSVQMANWGPRNTYPALSVLWVASHTNPVAIYGRLGKHHDSRGSNLSQPLVWVAQCLWLTANAFSSAHLGMYLLACIH